MKLLLELDIQDEKADFFTELLKSFSFLKFKTITPEKALLLAEMREAVDNLNLLKRGKLQGKPLSQLLDEL